MEVKITVIDGYLWDSLGMALAMPFSTHSFIVLLFIKINMDKQVWGEIGSLEDTRDYYILTIYSD
jgi:hypothetical protein